jgi:hypothetical protein
MERSLSCSQKPVTRPSLELMNLVRSLTPDLRFNNIIHLWLGQSSDSFLQVFRLKCRPAAACPPRSPWNKLETVISRCGPEVLRRSADGSRPPAANWVSSIAGVARRTDVSYAVTVHKCGKCRVEFRPWPSKLLPSVCKQSFWSYFPRIMYEKCKLPFSEFIVFRIVKKL